MKKVIDKKVYDTYTAQEVASISNGLRSSDWAYENEELYRTNKGRFFLYVKGGPKSKYGETNGRESWSSADIIAYTNEEALGWLMRHNKVDEIEELFTDALEEA